MDLNDRMLETADDGRKWFPKVEGNVSHTALGLVGEAGEIANLVKKYERYTIDWEDLCSRLPEEIIDVIVYCLKLASQIGMNVETEFDKKRLVNEKRFGQESYDIRTIGRNGDA